MSGSQRWAGHRTLPHTADARVEAWAPTREECIAEAVHGVVACFVDTADAVSDQAHRFCIDEREDSDLLVEVLNEVIYVLDTTGHVPADVRLSRTATGVEVEFGLVDVGDLPRVGAVPKGVSLHELLMKRTGQGWTCLVMIDV